MSLDPRAVRRLAHGAHADVGAALLRVQLLRVGADPTGADPACLLAALAEVEERLHAAAARIGAVVGAAALPADACEPAPAARLDA